MKIRQFELEMTIYKIFGNSNNEVIIGFAMPTIF